MQAATAYIGLGANLGDARGALRAAVQAIGQLPYTRLGARSSLYQTAPVISAAPGDVVRPPDPAYFNAVVEVQTQLSPVDLLAALQAIETAAGRERPYHHAPRTLDLDLLLYGRVQLHLPQLTVPHPRMLERAFVLVPLAEIAPSLVSSAQLEAVSDQGVERLGTL
jgi:2-amino-4-hydroxy-6-hydroxymethyldihydropteridine diphosphokinase